MITRTCERLCLIIMREWACLTHVWSTEKVDLDCCQTLSRVLSFKTNCALNVYIYIYIYINVISLLSVRKSLLKYLNYLKQTYCSAVVDTKLLLFILMFTVAPEIVLFFFFWFNFVNCFTFFSFSSSRLPEVLFWFLCRCCNVNSMKNQFDQPAD